MYMTLLFFDMHRVIIPIATKTHGVRKGAMFAAKNLLPMKELLLPTERQLKGQQCTKMLRIMLWYCHSINFKFYSVVKLKLCLLLFAFYTYCKLMFI